MDVPTLPAFAAMKTSAWADRRAARGLYDLAGLARIGALTRDSAVLAKAVTGLAVISSMFNRVSDADWEIQLAHQTRDLPEAQRCLIAVRNAYALSLGWPEPADPYD